MNPPDVTIGNQDNDVACTTPRPPVKVTVTPGPTGVLNATIQAGGGVISKIAFGGTRPLVNARVSVVGGQQDQTQPFSFLT